MASNINGSLSFPVFNRLKTYYDLKRRVARDGEQLLNSCSGFQELRSIQAKPVLDSLLATAQRIENTLDLLLLAHVQMIKEDR